MPAAMLSDGSRSLRGHTAGSFKPEGFPADAGNVSAVNAELRVESLRRRIDGLVAARQELRERGAAQPDLEQNRVTIAETQHELSIALIALYGREPAAEEAAA